MSLLVAAVALGPALLTAEDESATALYLDRAVELSEAMVQDGELWVTPEDLTAVNDFVLKPEGACLDELCIPLDQGPDSSLFRKEGDQTLMSLTGFARHVGQSVAIDESAATFSFSPVPAARSAFFERAMAPDFTLKNREGKDVNLSDFRGKKVMIITWASW